MATNSDSAIALVDRRSGGRQKEPRDPHEHDRQDAEQSIHQHGGDCRSRRHAQLRESVGADGVAADAGGQKRPEKRAHEEDSHDARKGGRDRALNRAEQHEPSVRHQRAIDDDERRWREAIHRRSARKVTATTAAGLAFQRSSAVSAVATRSRARRPGDHLVTNGVKGGMSRTRGPERGAPVPARRYCASGEKIWTRIRRDPDVAERRARVRVVAAAAADRSEPDDVRVRAIGAPVITATDPPSACRSCRPPNTRSRGAVVAPLDPK